MEVSKNNNNLIYFMIGVLFGFLCCLMSLNFAHASENKYLGMFDTLPDREGFDNIVVYDTEKDEYILYSLDNVEFYVLDNNLKFNGSAFSKGGSYFWSKEYNCWTADRYSYPSELDLAKYKIIHSDVNIYYSDSDDVYFYKTGSIISNKIYQPVQTVLFQNIQKNLKTLIPIGLLILGSMCGLYLVKKILDKFVY